MPFIRAVVSGEETITSWIARAGSEDAGPCGDDPGIIDWSEANGEAVKSRSNFIIDIEWGRPR